MVWNLVGILVLLALERKRHVVKPTSLGARQPFPVGEASPRLQWGKVWALYLIWYGLGRTWFESIRVDPSEVFLGIRSNVWGALAAIAVGIVLYIVQSRRHPGEEPGPYLPGRGPAGAVDSQTTYSDTDEADDDVGRTEKLATSGAGTKKP